METRRIKAKELVDDFASGMEDAALMRKYDLSARALMHALTKLVWQGLLAPSELVKRKSLIGEILAERQRRVVADDLLQDLRSGVGDAVLLERYRLSAKGLQRVLERLVDSGRAPHEEIRELSPLYREHVNRIEGRGNPRAYLKVPVPIYDTTKFTAGLLRDISRNGFRVVGIESKVGEVKTFQIPLDMFMQAEPLLVIGECRWVTTRGDEKKYVVAGYKMVHFSAADENAVRKFINQLLYTQSGEWQTFK